MSIHLLRLAWLCRGWLLLLAVLLLASRLAPAQTVLTGPAGSFAFGETVTVLPNGNYVITDNNATRGGQYGVGAVYLYNGTTNVLISTLTGSSASDQVGSGGVTVLTNGNYVVSSPNWHNGANAAVGAVTWCSSNTGTSGAVSTANSLTGSQNNDRVGSNGVLALTNGNYVVRSVTWNNGAATTAGAVTWGNGSTGTSGVVSTANSLTGSQTNDRVGYDGVTALTNGNYVVYSSNWANGAITGAGAATWGNGSTGTSGIVSAANSLVGSKTSDAVGNGVIALTNGNYVVISIGWANGAATSAGAATWGNGSTGTSGVVSTANSLTGSQSSDRVGFAVALSNGNYVVSSPSWANGANSRAGAITWCNGSTGRTGAVSTANSLTGSQSGDQVGFSGVTALTNGNYVVGSRNWANGAATSAGAATWGNGSTGTTGAVSAANSLVGSQTNDGVGVSVTALTNGNYVVSSPSWANGAATNAGAVTWGNGSTGRNGAVSTANSLTGSQSGDQVGTVTALTNGNYVVSSSYWDNGTVVNAGAVTWGNGSTGRTGAVSTANSLTGSLANDQVGGGGFSFGGGGITVLTNGNYVVGSPVWAGTAYNAGAATWGNGSTGITGAVSTANSLTGSQGGDLIGSGGIKALTNGNYVVSSNYWGNGAATSAGAVTWGNGTTGTSGSVGTANSLTGSQTNDRVGNSGVTPQPNGNYVVKSNSWDNGSITDAGALTLGDGAGTTTGPVTGCNSILGSVASSGFGATLSFAYRASTNTLIGGLPTENKVQVGTGTPAPTGVASQNLSSGATVANLAATGTAIQWYAASTGGSALASTTPLVSGTTYYATQTVGGCESTSRLAVTVTLPAPPALTSVSPANATRAASATGNVTATFDQPLSAGSASALKVFSAQRGGLRTATTPATVSGSALTFAPSAYAFRPGETVQATVTTAAQNSNGTLATPRVWQFTAAAGMGPGTYSGTQDVAMGTGPISVTSADVDGDGDLDALTSNYYSSSVSVRLNNGSGLYSGGSTPAVGVNPRSVVMADVDGDGDLDLLTANNNGGGGTVSVRLNNGSGVFAGGPDVPTGTGTTNVALGDVDGDGDLDILATNYGSNTVSVRLNNGSGMFSGTQAVAVGSGPVGVAVADVDGDGDLDLLTANNTGNTVSVRLNNGAGIFSGGSDPAVSAAPMMVAVGDVDGDADLDILVSSGSSGGVSVRLNNGSGSFSGTQQVATSGSQTFGVTVGDVDGDGDLDFATPNYSANTVSVRLNNGSGVFSGTQEVAVGPTPYSVALGDVDGDGDLDLLVANHNAGGAGSLSVRLNQAPLTLTSVSPANATRAASATGPVTATFNQSVTSGSTAALKVFSPQRGGLRNGSGTTTVSGSTVSFAPTYAFRPGETVQATVTTAATAAGGGGLAASRVWQFTAAAGVGPGTFSGGSDVAVATGPRSVAVGDVDGDGDLDLLTANFGSNLISVQFNNGSGSFLSNISYFVGSGPISIAVGDVDSDGDLDLLTANIYSNTVSVRLNNGSGEFGSGSDPAVGTSPYSVAVGDVDGDGDLDLLTANSGSNTMSVRFNNGSGGFSGGSDQTVGSSPYSVAVGDVDSDGDLDLLIANQNGNTVSVRLNNGSGVFSGGSESAVGNSPRGVAVADVDGDGDLDLLTANWSASTVSVRLNNGSGTFSGGSDVSIIGFPESVAVGDVDGDGDLDVCASNSGGNIVSLRLNDGSGSFLAGSDPTMNGTSMSIALGDVDGDNDLDLLAVNYGNTVSVRLNQSPAPTLTSLSPSSGTLGSTISLNGTNLTGATAITFAGSSGNVVTSGFTVNAAGTQITGVVVPSGAATGNVAVTTPSGTSNGVAFTVISDLTVSTGTLASPTTVAPGTYNSITISSNGVAQLSGSTTVNSAVTVNGALLTNCQPLTGTASFSVAAGATLGVCDPAGLSSMAGTGAVQTTGPRSFSPAASYVYNGTAAQVTGNALPVQVLNLTTTNNQPVTLTQPVQVKQVLTVAGAGNLALNGQALTLLSDASGTALVVNSGSGVVQGSTGTMQRYIDASGNLGSSGYRHYSAPVSGSTVADLGTATFTPTLNATYNSSATPGAVRPYPTVFGYDETRLTTSPATGLSAFDKGWFSPVGATDALTMGRGYTVQLGNNELVDFTGTFVTGPLTIGGLTRGPQADAGWHLVGNPYPAPLDWGTVGSGQLSGVNPAIYVYQSTGPYAGQYRALVNGIGAGTGLIPAGQGFFVRAATAGSTGSITLSNANRSTTFAGQPALQRGSDLRPQLRLSLGVGSQPATPTTALDELFVYQQAGATPAFDGAYDAPKLANPNGYYLASTSADAPGQPLGIDGRPLSGLADEVIPLWLSGPAGTYTLTATELANLGTTVPYLRDALAGTLTRLDQQASYSFAVAAGAATAGRFALVLRSSGALATAPALATTLVSLYPNPTAAATTLSATGLPAQAATVEAVLLDAVGQQVGRYTLPVRQEAASQALPTAGLASGLYVLRFTVRDAQGQPLGQLPVQRLSVQ